MCKVRNLIVAWEQFSGLSATDLKPLEDLVLDNHPWVTENLWKSKFPVKFQKTSRVKNSNLEELEKQYNGISISLTVCVCVLGCSIVWLVVTSWIVAYLAPVSMDLWGYWVGLPFPPPGIKWVTISWPRDQINVYSLNVRHLHISSNINISAREKHTI